MENKKDLIEITLTKRELTHLLMSLRSYDKYLFEQEPDGWHEDSIMNAHLISKLSNA